uniref:Uncharacterized protein n=1 Tax=Picea sitchensis TaxID=3332 RepID=B8LMW9_PICSI|nr:unknown [Picea sitchensis]
MNHSLTCVLKVPWQIEIKSRHIPPPKLETTEGHVDGRIECMDGSIGAWYTTRVLSVSRGDL